MNRIPILSLTHGQQGGIGWPPSIVRIGKRWYGVADSRKRRTPEELEPYLEVQRMWQSQYIHKPTKYWHHQLFIAKVWHKGPKLTWQEVLEKAIKLNSEGSNVRDHH